jgi:hypothetical protein
MTNIDTNIATILGVTTMNNRRWITWDEVKQIKNHIIMRSISILELWSSMCWSYIYFLKQKWDKIKLLS